MKSKLDKMNRVGFWDRAFVKANCFEWVWGNWCKPSYWGSTPQRELYRNKLHRSTMRIIKLFTTHKSRSRAWWLVVLGRSEEAWKAWYKKEGIPSFIDKMLNKAQFRCNSNPDNIWYELWFAILLFVEYLKERNASKRRGEGK